MMIHSVPSLDDLPRTAINAAIPLDRIRERRRPAIDTMRSILLDVSDDDGLDSRVMTAVTLAEAFDGHVTCLHVTSYQADMGMDPLLAMAVPMDFAVEMERLRAGLKARVEAILTARAVPWTWHHRDGATPNALIRGSLLNDLIVVSLPGQDTSPGQTALVSSVAIGARAPVLAVPGSGPTLDIAGAALVAWDGSEEASVALRQALPLLQQAASVHLIQVEEGADHAEISQGGLYLARHGVNAEVCHRLRHDGDVGAAILKLAAHLEIDLIVMGAYGHSRLTELLLGGATRTMLADSPIPLFLAH